MCLLISRKSLNYKQCSLSCRPVAESGPGPIAPTSPSESTAGLPLVLLKHTSVKRHFLRCWENNGRVADLFRYFVISDKTVKNKNRRIIFPWPSVLVFFFLPVFLLEMPLSCFVNAIYPQAKSDWVNRHQGKNDVWAEVSPREMGNWQVELQLRTVLRHQPVTGWNHHCFGLGLWQFSIKLREEENRNSIVFI